MLITYTSIGINKVPMTLSLHYPSGHFNPKNEMISCLSRLMSIGLPHLQMSYMTSLGKMMSVPKQMMLERNRARMD